MPVVLILNRNNASSVVTYRCPSRPNVSPFGTAVTSPPTTTRRSSVFLRWNRRRRRQISGAFGGDGGCGCVFLFLQSSTSSSLPSSLPSSSTNFLLPSLTSPSSRSLANLPASLFTTRNPTHSLTTLCTMILFSSALVTVPIDHERRMFR